MQLYPIKTGNFKLDGGAMFGVVPKVLWQQTNPADSKNRIDLTARCLLIQEQKRLILIDSGMGDKQSQKFFGHYSLWGKDNLLDALHGHGFHPDEITDVCLTHLHFDHCGGVVVRDRAKNGYRLLFKNAIIWSNSAHWDWATSPNAREKASFLSENIHPILESGQLDFVQKKTSKRIQTHSELGFDIIFADGHTEKQMLPKIQYKDKTIVFVADLLPTVGHIPLPYVMGYDTRPLLTLDEKKWFLDAAADQKWYLFMEHDPKHEIITVKHTPRGVRLDTTYSCNEIFN